MPRGNFSRSRRLLLPFFARPVERVARELVGCALVLQQGDLEFVLRLVEVEAYLGEGRDPASHAHRGRTGRNAQMYETPGRLYVYFTYGMHHCMNVVCEQAGVAGAVLLRAAEPLAGTEIMEFRRGRGGRELSNGPAKLCQALEIDLDWNGADLVDGSMGLWPLRKPKRLAKSSRIGIRRGRELQLRFFDPDSRYLSRRPP